MTTHETLNQTAHETLKSFPLTTVTSAFFAGFAAGSGMTGAAVTGMGLLTKNAAVRRVAIVAWPLVRRQLSGTMKDGASSFAKDLFSTVASKMGGTQSA